MISFWYLYETLINVNKIVYNPFIKMYASIVPKIIIPLYLLSNTYKI